ncbi:TMV resistance protein N-like [Rosa chinensis]|uniref:TMV resistance protein N-like n=1 Tax=Rosa chinensis TaxID=74649 RepID=UPI000D096AD3|nr:TMV resistance protein N-like [Rosa chinensis]
MGQTASASLPSSTRSSSVASVSLPPSGPQWKYDVFLSFRGEDTRKGFLSHLYHELQYTRINTFKDDKELEVGAPISPSLLKAIEESRLAIVVLSPNYASSSWCLEELRKIAQCMIDNNRILPLFYHMDTSDVRKQKGSFEEAFIKHENSLRHKNNVQYWRDALVKVASFSGWHTQNYRTERQLVEDIVEYVCNKVQPIEIEFATSTVEFEAFEATREAMDNEDA